MAHTITKTLSFRLHWPIYKKYKAAQLFSSLIISNKNSWAVNQPIRMISEGPCETEDLNTDFWKCSIAFTRFKTYENRK